MCVLYSPDCDSIQNYAHTHAYHILFLLLGNRGDRFTCCLLNSLSHLDLTHFPRPVTHPEFSLLPRDHNDMEPSQISFAGSALSRKWVWYDTTHEMCLYNTNAGLEIHLNCVLHHWTKIIFWHRPVPSALCAYGIVKPVWKQLCTALQCVLTSPKPRSVHLIMLSTAEASWHWGFVHFACICF